MFQIKTHLLRVLLLSSLVVIAFADTFHDYVIRGFIETDDLPFAITVRDYARAKKDMASLKEREYKEYTYFVDTSSTTQIWGVRFNLYFTDVNKNLRDAFITQTQALYLNVKVTKMWVRWFPSDNRTPGLCEPDVIGGTIIK